MITCIRLGRVADPSRIDSIESDRRIGLGRPGIGQDTVPEKILHAHPYISDAIPGGMKVHRGDVEQPELVGEWHATRTGILTEVASPKPAGVPLGPVYEKKSTIPAEIAFCRVCWDESNPKNSDDPLQTLVQPCLCRGSQANIHLSCLKAWQRAVLQNSVTMGDERAFRCGVCKAVYAIPPDLPIHASAMYKNACLRVLRLALVIACSFSLYCGIENAYMWPMMGFIGLALPPSDRGVRAAMCLSILSVIVVLRFLAPFLDIKSLTTMLADVSEGSFDGGVRGSRTSSHGVDLKPGTLLLASHSGGAFSDTAAVLLFSHSATNGSQGVILNQRILSRADSLESGCFGSSSDSITECARGQDGHSEIEGVAEPIHYFGGPTFALERLVIMHMFSDIPGSREIVLARNGGEPSARAAEVERWEGLKESGVEREDGNIFLGGSMADVLAERWQAGSEHKPVWIFHGVTTWTSGQLAEEIENGVWTVKSGTLDDLMYFSNIFAGLHDD